MDMKIKLKTKGLIILGIFVLSFIGIISITVVTVQDKIISTALEKLRSDMSLGQALYNELIPGEYAPHFLRLQIPFIDRTPPIRRNDYGL